MLFLLRKSLVKPVMRQKTCNYNVLFGSSTEDRPTRCIYQRTFREQTLNVPCMTIWSGRTEQLVIIAGFLPHHWLYGWFSQFRSCGTYSVLSQSPSVRFWWWCGSQCRYRNFLVKIPLTGSNANSQFDNQEEVEMAWTCW